MVSVDTLRSIELFQGLDDAQLSRIAGISKEENHKAGSTMLKEEGKAQRLYILLEGKILLKMRVETKPHLPASYATVAIINKGQTFNWAALVEPCISTLSAECLENVRVVSIDGSKLINLMEEDNAMGYQIMKRIVAVIASRLRHTRQALIAERGTALL